MKRLGKMLYEDGDELRGKWVYWIAARIELKTAKHGGLSLNMRVFAVA